MESMDLSETDSKRNGPSTCVDDVSSSYATSFLESFLPAYQMVNQSAISCVSDRYKAIRFAADASLALTATGASWSDALSKKLVEVCVGSASQEALSEDGLSRNLDMDESPTTLSSICEQTAELDSSDLREPSGLSGALRWETKAVRNPLGRREGLPVRRNYVLRLVGREGRSMWSRDQRFSRDASRLAILRTVSLKNRSKRRLLRSATVRKPKSLLRTRRRLPQCPKTIECPERERGFENGIVALQRLVPGGSNMDAAVLLDETADFVKFLELQVQALQSVANAVCE